MLDAGSGGGSCGSVVWTDIVAARCVMVFIRSFCGWYAPLPHARTPSSRYARCAG